MHKTMDFLKLAAFAAVLTLLIILAVKVFEGFAGMLLAFGG